MCLTLLHVHTQKNVPVCKKHTKSFPDENQVFMHEIDQPLTLSHKNPVFMPVIKIKTGSLACGSRCVMMAQAAQVPSLMMKVVSQLY